MQLHSDGDMGKCVAKEEKINTIARTSLSDRRVVGPGDSNVVASFALEGQGGRG